MALSYLTDINLNKNELQNAVIQKVGTDPSSGLTAGWILNHIFDNDAKYIIVLAGGSMVLGAIAVFFVDEVTTQHATDAQNTPNSNEHPLEQGK